MPIIPKDQLRALIKEYNLKDPKDIQYMLKKLFGDTLQEMLEAELDHELGYSKYDYKNKQTDNSRNGYSSKIVKSNHGKVELNIPRDRNGDFEPQVVKKNQSDISSIATSITEDIRSGGGVVIGGGGSIDMPMYQCTICESCGSAFCNNCQRPSPDPCPKCGKSNLKPGFADLVHKYYEY